MICFADLAVCRRVENSRVSQRQSCMIHRRNLLKELFHFFLWKLALLNQAATRWDGAAGRRLHDQGGVGGRTLGYRRDGDEARRRFDGLPQL